MTPQRIRQLCDEGVLKYTRTPLGRLIEAASVAASVAQRAKRSEAREITPEQRAAILAARGRMGRLAAAKQFGVTPYRVWMIWNAARDDAAAGAQTGER